VMSIDRLSPHFSYHEGTHSDTAVRQGIPNEPDEMQLSNMVALCKNVLEPLRLHFGKPIRVNSMFRSQKLNELIGGSSVSQHCKGEAVDIVGTGGLSNKMIFDYIVENLEFDQIIWEFGTDENPNWVHVSYKREGQNRGKLTRALRENGHTVYRAYSSEV
ncbi:MAG: D-Ala-D-Ala carboxypeptidase family metallohydrolase, partial [Cytophagales bacterium]|nr:D-Ala-D-Ala carboxypeptidase family metallohydrolase [Cytophagales bacterium]